MSKDVTRVYKNMKTGAYAVLTSEQNYTKWFGFKGEPIKCIGTFEPWSFCKIWIENTETGLKEKKNIFGTAMLHQVTNKAMKEGTFRGFYRVDEETLGLLSVSENIEAVEAKNELN